MGIEKNSVLPQNHADLLRLTENIREIQLRAPCTVKATQRNNRGETTNEHSDESQTFPADEFVRNRGWSIVIDRKSGIGAIHQRGASDGGRG